MARKYTTISQTTANVRHMNLNRVWHLGPTPSLFSPDLTVLHHVEATLQVTALLLVVHGARHLCMIKR